MPQRNLPGTTVPYASWEGDAFALLEPMLQAAGGMSLSQVCAITGLEGSTVQNWVKRGWVARPVQKKYHKRQLARILILNALHGSLQLDQIVALLTLVNGQVESRLDDTVEESRLYDYLCRAIRMLDPIQGISADQVDRVVAQAIADYTGPSSDYTGPAADFAAVLARVLQVMVYGYLTGEMKNQTDLLYAAVISGKR